MQAKQFELARRETDLQTREQDLKKREADLEMTLNSMDPQLKALKYESEQVNQSKRDAEDYWGKVRKQADSVLFAESEIIAKEREMFVFADQIKARRFDLESMKSEILESLKLADDKQKLLQTERFNFYDCAMAISSELGNIRKYVAVFEEKNLFASTSTGEYIFTDSIRKIERTQTKIDGVIKILAEKIAPSSNILKDVDRLRLLNLHEIPNIKIKAPSSNAPLSSPLAISSVHSLLDRDLVEKTSKDHLDPFLKANPAEEELKLSIEMASSSLDGLKEIGFKYGISV